jgi:hypothetical protein
MNFYQGPTKMQHNIIVQSCFTHLERRARLPFCQDYEMSFLSRAWALSGLRVVIVVVMPSRQVAASVTRRMYRRLTPRTQPQLDCFPMEFSHHKTPLAGLLRVSRMLMIATAVRSTEEIVP